MKKVNSLSIVIILIMLLTNIQITAQNADAKLVKTVVVNKSADDVWEIVRDLDTVDKYSSLVGSLTLEGGNQAGATRVCYTPDKSGHFKENIIAFDDDKRSYSYAIVEGTPAKGMVNNFKIVDLGYQKSMIVWWSNYEQFMENPQMTEEQFIAFMDSTVQEWTGNMAAAAK